MPAQKFRRNFKNLLTLSNVCFKLSYETTVWGHQAFLEASKMESTNSETDKTVQERLLDAAERLFADHGYEGTSVRDLAGAADCNVASVNYYFGGKENLYTEVWRRQMKAMVETRLASIEQVMAKGDGPPSVEDLLRSFAYAFIGPLLDESKSGRVLRLYAREMVAPHLPENTFVEEVVRPTMGAMHQALLKVCPELKESKVPLVMFSIAGQLAHVAHIKSMMEHVDSDDMPVFDLGQYVEHVVNFSAGGIRACFGRKC
jgi:AcrR family transcriptional regulator